MANINRFAISPRILIAPLDWGLGHATRCIPIIRELLAEGAEVFIAAEGPVASLLSLEFPSIEIISIPGYLIKWPGKIKNILWLLKEYNRISKVIQLENQWLDKIIDEKKIHGVISDCRFGLSSNKIPCVFITHQLHIETGVSLLTRLAGKINYRHINKFTSCWVPDNPDDSCAGKLAHPKRLPAIPVKYIGMLSRFSRMEMPVKYNYLYLLSGPEPQRSKLELKLLSLNSDNKKIALVKGLPGIQEHSGIGTITTFNHLPSAALNSLIAESEVVICRSGYSSVMDLICLGKKAVLIPTPGQSEQNYLAHYLNKRKLFICQEQETVSDSIFNQTPPVPLLENKSLLKETIEEWLATLKN